MTRNLELNDYSNLPSLGNKIKTLAVSILILNIIILLSNILGFFQFMPFVSYIGASFYKGIVIWIFYIRLASTISFIIICIIITQIIILMKKKNIIKDGKTYQSQKLTKVFITYFFLELTIIIFHFIFLAIFYDAILYHESISSWAVGNANKLYYFSYSTIELCSLISLNYEIRIYIILEEELLKFPALDEHQQGKSYKLQKNNSQEINNGGRFIFATILILSSLSLLGRLLPNFFSSFGYFKISKALRKAGKDEFKYSFQKSF